MLPGRHILPPMMEAFCAAARPRLTEANRRALRELGLDVDRPFPLSWPATHFAAWVRILARAFAPGVSDAEAQRQLGQAFITSWQRTLVGSAMATMLRFAGPRRSLLKLGMAWRTADDFTEVTVEDQGPGRAVVTFNEVLGIPDLYRGQLEAGGALVGAKELRVTQVDGPGPGARFLLEYSEA